ncbi:hypothetical protein TNCV_2325261 [Trichonephila clavipes]|nr:hypothetical protein TNCV_2325261 [Trichonephila clavipes]
MSFTRSPGSGRLRQTSSREDQHIVRNARVQPTASSAAIQAQVSGVTGSQKRKIRKEKEYNIKSKYAKLDNFLISASSSSCASASSSRPIDADLREQILKLGPYQPEGNFQKDVKGRSFSSSYSFISKAGQKIERKWLSYSTRLHVA